jgi:hypothetical protein
MQPEEAVEIDGGIGARSRARHRDIRPQTSVFGFAERHDHVQSVDGATLEDRHEQPLAGGSRRRRARENDGAKPSESIVIAPDFRKTRRDVMGYRL